MLPRGLAIVVVVVGLGACGGGGTTAKPLELTTGSTSTTGHPSASKATVRTAGAVAALLGCSSTLRPVAAVAFGIAPVDLFPKRVQGAGKVLADALARAEAARVQQPYLAQYAMLDAQRTVLEQQDSELFYQMTPFMPLLNKSVPDPPEYTRLNTERSLVDKQLGDVEAMIQQHFLTPPPSPPLVHKAHCAINREDITIDVYTDSGQRKNAEEDASTIGCRVAKGFGIKSVSYVVGDNWTASAQTATTTNLMAHQSGANEETLHCG